ncbi:MAG TPA: Sir2 family NAD-dependent protein deacetylase, partial [Longimicrobiales bacterium]
ELTVVTQNVDDLHTRAGSRDVLELHGNLFRFLCSREYRPVAYEDTTAAAAESLTLEAIERGEGQEPPVCPDCGAPLRPDVVWFGEPLRPRTYALAEQKTLGCDVFFVIGTSAVVYPAAALPSIARRAGALTIEVNPAVTEFTERADVSLRGKAGEILPRLVELITGAPQSPAGDPPAPRTPRSGS